MSDSIEQLIAAAEANPVHPESWGALAQALFASGDFPGTVQAALHAAELGYGEFGEMMVLASRAAIRDGQIDSASELMQLALDLRYRDIGGIRADPDFAPLMSLPNISYRFGLPAPDSTRDQGWQGDIEFFEQELLRRSANPFALVSAEEMDSAIAWVFEHVAELSDAEILLNLGRLLVALQDGHAYVCPALERADLLAALPVGFYRFEEGVFITHAASAYAHLIGLQVAEIEGRSMAEVAQEIVPTICTDNPHWPSEIVPFRLRETAFLHALGLTAHPDRVTLRLMDDAGNFADHTVMADNEFPTAPLGRNFPFPDQWVTALDRLPEQPLSIRDLRTPFWFEPIHELDAIYLQINNMRDGDDETFAAFTDRFFAMLHETNPDRLIIDIRMNKGGNTTLEWPFLHTLIASPWNQPGKLFVIIGRRTWSAAQNFATYLDLHSHAIFAGEPTGSSPSFTGESIEFVLPWSGTRVNISDLQWQSGWPWDRRPWIPPDLFAQPTWEAYRAGRDVALEAIAREIAQPTLS